MSVESLLVRAEKYLQTAALLLETGDYASSISRAFYAMLFATRAALRTRELDPSTHKGVFTLFNEHFIQFLQHQIQCLVQPVYARGLDAFGRGEIFEIVFGDDGAFEAQLGGLFQAEI